LLAARACGIIRELRSGEGPVDDLIYRVYVAGRLEAAFLLESGALDHIVALPPELCIQLVRVEPGRQQKVVLELGASPSLVQRYLDGD
jgi:hypothetical protein